MLCLRRISCVQSSASAAQVPLSLLLRRGVGEMKKLVMEDEHHEQTVMIQLTHTGTECIHFAGLQYTCFLGAVIYVKMFEIQISPCKYIQHGWTGTSASGRSHVFLGYVKILTRRGTVYIVFTLVLPFLDR